MWQNLKNQNMTKLKNPKYDKTQKLKFLQNWKYERTKKISMGKKSKIWNSDKYISLNCDNTHKLKLWIKRTQNSNCYKTQKLKV